MDAQILIKALRASTDAARAQLQGVRSDGRARWAHISPASLRPFVDAICADPDCSSIDRRRYTLPRNDTLLDLRSACVYLVDRALDVDAEIVIRDLERFIRTCEVNLLRVRAIEGVSIEQEVYLGEGCSILPPSALPPVQETLIAFSAMNAPRHGWGRPPSAALVVNETFKVASRPAEAEGHCIPESNQALEAKFERALAAVTLASIDGAPQIRDCYDIVLSPGWPGMACGGMGSSESFPVWVPPNRSIDPSLAIDVFIHLRKHLPQLDLALDKLRASRRRQSFAESVVDLGTCLEILLMHGAKDNNEIAYKIATRAAWLLGSDGTERLKIFRQARDLYSARSKAVHSGVAPNANKKGNDQALGEFDQLCAAILRRLAALGAWPDWTELVLGAEY